jgi:hypothetical protein
MSKANTSPPPDARAPDTVAESDSLCWRCVHHRPIKAPRSTFVLCTALPVKYPRQPMPTCGTFRRV